MMKTIRLFIALAMASAMLVGTSCTKEISNDIESQSLVFTASLDEVTKTTLDMSTGANHGKVYWEAGDEVSINGVIFKATPDPSDATKATLTKKSSSASNPKAPYTACYPASIYSSGKAVFPKEQQYASGNDISGVNPMVATSSETDLHFTNMGGLVEITLSGSNGEKVENITLGDHRLLCGNGVTLSKNGTKFLIALPAGNYSQLTLYVALTNGLLFENKSKSAVKIDRNTINTIKLAVNDLNTAAVRLWNGGPYWAVKNIGAENPQDYGYYFTWGNTVGYVLGENGFVVAPGYTGAGTALSEGFTSTTYKATSGYGLTSDIVAGSSNDAAHVAWGGGWRMPSVDEYNDLISGSYTTNTWVENYNGTGIKGRTYVSKVAGYTDTPIFLPAGGRGASNKITSQTSFGYYWTTGYTGTSYAWDYELAETSETMNKNSVRNNGRSIRAILNY